MRVHVVIAVLAGLVAWWLRLEPMEISVLVLVIANVIVAEMINTAIENIVDLVSPGQHVLAKNAKDIAAGAVLIMASASVIIGILLFWRKFFC